MSYGEFESTAQDIDRREGGKQDEQVQSAAHRGRDGMPATSVVIASSLDEVDILPEKAKTLSQTTCTCGPRVRELREMVWLQC